MKILFNDFLYKGLTDNFYESLNHSNFSYDHLKDELSRFSYQWLPYFYLEGKSRNLDINIIYSQDIVLQKKWAIENDIQFSRNWEEEIAIQQIKAFLPDFYFFAGNFKYYKFFFNKIKPFVGKIGCWISSSIPSNLNISDVDIMISDNDKILEYAKSKNCRTAKMLSSVPLKRELKSFNDRQNQIIFTGSLGRQFKERANILKSLASEDLGLKIFGMGLSEDLILTLPIEVIIRRYFPGMYRELSRRKILPIFNPLKRYVEPPVFGKKMFNLLENSCMVINMHSSFDLNYAINMRVFEALSAGCLLFTEKYVSSKVLRK